MLTKEQAEKVGEAFQRERGNRPIYDEEYDVLDRWAADAVINHSMLEAVLSGMLLVNVTDGEVTFRHSVDGESHVKALLENSDEAKAMIAKLEAKKEEIAEDVSSEIEWPKKNSLPARILQLLYFVNRSEAPNTEQIAAMMGCTDSAAQIAVHALQQHDMIGPGPEST